MKLFVEHVGPAAIVRCVTSLSKGVRARGRPRAGHRGAICVVAAATFCACSGWGPTQYISGRYVYGSDSSATRTAIVVTYVEQQAPTGLAAFPDGGSPRVLKRGMLVYLCHAVAAPLRFLGFVPQTDASPNVDVRVLAWHADGFDAAFREYDVQSPLFSAFHVDTTGLVRPLGVPTDTVEASQDIAPVCQRTVDSLNLSSAQRGQAGFREQP